MKTKKYFRFYLLILLTFLSMIFYGCASAESAPASIESREPRAGEVAGEFTQVDDALNKFLLGNIAYNGTPETMLIDEISTFELLLSASKSQEELRDQINELGAVDTKTIEITPRMKVELRAQDLEAFEIQPIHDNAEQIISESQITRWAWWVKAKKTGVQSITLTVYRLVKYENKEYWWIVENYQRNITVEITFAQRIKSIDWKWLIITIIPAILIPAFWRWIDNKKKKEETI